MKKLFFVLLLVPTVGFFWSTFSSTPESELAFNRIWLSHEPKHESDKFHAFALLEDDEVGGFVYTSLFQGDFEVFSYRVNDNKLQITMLQSKKKHKTSFKATRCNEKGFEYCLELRGSPRGPKRYYSKTGLEIDSLETLQTTGTTLLQSK